MYSDLARPAMTTETRGQNSWVNYGPHGESNRAASAADTTYAPQKVGLMPEWTMRDRGSAEPIVTYRGGPHAHAMVDMSKIGTGEGSGVRGHGMYSAEAQDIAKGYRIFTAVAQDPLIKKYGLTSMDADTLGKDLKHTEGDHVPIIEELNDFITNLKAKQDQGDTSAMTKNNIDRSQKMIKYLSDPNRAKGHMYQVAIDRPPQQFLDWEKSLHQQSPEVKEALRPMMEDMGRKIKKEQEKEAAQARDKLSRPQSDLMKKVYQGKLSAALQPYDWTDLTGEQLYEMAGRSALGHHPAETIDRRTHYPAAAEYLRAKGLSGVKYAAGKNFGVPPGAEGTSNYVSFYPERILKRYAIPGMVGSGLAGTVLAGKGQNGS
jgi:hypothetical protein